ncbi:hypothetical protein LSAT2_007951 [Lamellibrachia satsuma]|nr:hypothetical protein LSAT2_007951 [Lamellibrachia satsuma]
MHTGVTCPACLVLALGLMLWSDITPLVTGSSPQTKEELNRLVIPMSVTVLILVIMLGLVTAYYCNKHSAAICSCTCCRKWLVEHKRLSSLGSNTVDNKLTMQVMRGGCPCSTNATNTSHMCCENCMLLPSMDFECVGRAEKFSVVFWADEKYHKLIQVTPTLLAVRDRHSKT